MTYPSYWPGQSIAPGTVYATPTGKRATILSATYPWVRMQRGPLVSTVKWQDFFRTYREVVPCDTSSRSC